MMVMAVILRRETIEGRPMERSRISIGRRRRSSSSSPAAPASPEAPALARAAAAGVPSPVEITSAAAADVLRAGGSQRPRAREGVPGEGTLLPPLSFRGGFLVTTVNALAVVIVVVIVQSTKNLASVLPNIFAEAASHTSISMLFNSSVTYPTFFPLAIMAKA
eukprot:CAMPEP_0196138960 /NCGR_PEP_ID=MMETSP0910-20130528/6409_1 /TAXON_ID=49265 /ORGANISM="Thalassiosira rotula, Strain GSO102" /LENGTH=162 /DNA_ID=CAMNT_0041399631 /DNA_START=53 /DNA_END=542 /DNA_ORIENTATION=+